MEYTSMRDPVANAAKRCEPLAEKCEAARKKS
jgi:hypothetical protein